MDLNYSFLKDELALEEIRKHKWIESEKYGREIGFATAAVDWVKKFGAQWKEFRFGLETAENVFAERRTYRRFSCRAPVRLKINNTVVAGHVESINLLGFSCELDQVVPENSQVESAIDFPKGRAHFFNPWYCFSSRVVRITRIQDAGRLAYRAFFRFDESMKNYLRAHSGFLSSITG